MKLIYAWVALLVIVIAGVALYIYQLYTMPSPQSKSQLPKIRTELAEKYEQRAEQLSDSALSMANRLKTIQGSLNQEQEKKINRLLDHAAELKANAVKIKEKVSNDTEVNEILRTCNVIYGEASAICKQLTAEPQPKSPQK